MFKQYVMRKLIAQGYTEEQALKEYERRHKLASEVPADFGPAWIDNLDTIRAHFAGQQGGN